MKRTFEYPLLPYRARAVNQHGAHVDNIPDFIQCILGPGEYQKLVDQAHEDIEIGNLSTEKEEMDS